MSFTDRPNGPSGEGDFRLRSVAKHLAERIADTQRSFDNKKLRLTNRYVEVLAETLTEFGEDLHNGIGIWAAYESHNLRCFGMPLPVTHKHCHTEVSGAGIEAQRVHHFLWCIYPQLLPRTLVAPGDPDIIRLADAATESLNRGFKKVPASSGVSAFLGRSNEFGWEIKRKLVWLGSRSYLFRAAFKDYLAAHKAAEGDDENIDVTDDFICQECTAWSGLGAIDVLAAVLDISEADLDDLRSWNERHVAPYSVLTAGVSVMRVLNLVSGKEYPVRMNVEYNPFKVGSMVVGGLTPWRGEWYWSGRQKVYADPSDEAVEDMRYQFFRGLPRFVSRYCEGYASKAAEHCRTHYEKQVAAFGKDLVVFPDGLSFASFLENWARQPFQDLSPEEREKVQGMYGLTQSGPRLDFPEALVRSEHEIGVFFSPEEHMEVMDHFDTLIRGLENRSQPLPEDEADAIRGFINSPQISPAFVRHVAALHGVDSIKSAFLLGACDDEYCLEYLLRRHKGAYFKKRYPPMALVGWDERNPD